jgi:hypothetical protein
MIYYCENIHHIMKTIVLLLLFPIICISLSAQQLHWKINPANQQSPADVSMAGYPDQDWVPGVVPGTVFYAYVKAGKEKDPDYADNIYNVDKTKYNKPFWYRAEFSVKTKGKQRVWLQLNGTNKYAHVYVNGKQLGYLHGHMQRGIYDITDLLLARNAVAVLVSPPAQDHDLANRESPTYLSSGSWDWMPAVPGLNSGITDTVALLVTGPVRVADPHVAVAMKDTTAATVRISAEVVNSSPLAVKGKLKAVISPGHIIRSAEVTLPAGAKQEIKLDAYELLKPHLWWPNGYGEQYLYHCQLSFETGSGVSDSLGQSFGVRMVSSDTTSLHGPMRVYINQVPVLLKGGNWGMSDYLLKVRDKDYETRIKLHQDMNFNMIRNWTGEVTDEAFYEYCDQYGIMVWDDFWLNNFGPIDSLSMFKDNVIEKLKKLRNHPSIVIWCGANEGVPGGNPTGDISNVITAAIAAYDGDSRLYLPRSNAGVANPNFSIQGGSRNLSGSGIWANIDPKTYFVDPHNGYLFSNNSWGMRSELGMATFVNVESFKKFMPPADWVVPTPDSVRSKTNMWARHFFSTDGALGGGADPVKYINDVNSRYGASSSLEEFCKKSQLLNLETMKAMYEAWNDHLWNDASGMLIWMSQSAYPSMIWQTYDYYYDLTGAYFGAKSACEPVHIQRNLATGMVKVINNKKNAFAGLTALAKVYNPAGDVVSTQKAVVNVAGASLAEVFSTVVDSTELRFVRLQLLSGDKLISENNYWAGDLNKLTAARLKVTGNGLTYTVTNTSAVVAAGVRVQLMDDKGKQILPALISDSYFMLMPGEKKQIKVEVSSALLKNGYKLQAKAYNE